MTDGRIAGQSINSLARDLLNIKQDFRCAEASFRLPLQVESGVELAQSQLLNVCIKGRPKTVHATLCINGLADIDRRHGRVDYVFCMKGICNGCAKHK